MKKQFLVNSLALAVCGAFFSAMGATDLGLRSTWPAPASYPLGRGFVFTLSLTNAGPEVAPAVWVTNELPAVLRLDNVAVSQGAWSVDGAKILWAAGEMSNQQSATMGITVTPVSAGTFTNVASVGPWPDTNPADNSVTNKATARHPFVYIAFPSTNIVEGDSGTTNAAFALWLESPAPQTASVNFYTAGGSASPGLDYVSTNAALQFPPGVLTQYLNIPVIGDRLFETGAKISGEDFYVYMATPTNTLIEQRISARCVIQDDDPVPALSVGDVAIVEGQAGATQAVFKVALSEPSGVATPFRWTTTNLTATSGSDYAAASVQTSIPAGQTNLALAVNVYGDTEPECDETFAIFLSNAQYATIARTQATCTILADEMVLQMPGAVNEDDGILPGAGRVILSCAASSALVVSLLNSRPDLVSVPAAVLMLPGETNGVFPVQVLDDSLLNGSRAAIITALATNHVPVSATLTVHDDETTALSLLVPPVMEEGSGTWTAQVVTALAPGADVVVSLSCSDTNSIQCPDSVVIPAGQLSTPFLLQVPDDFLLDGNKPVTLTARVQNWTEGTASATVLDRTNLTVTLPATLLENRWATGLVQTAAATTSNLPITLSVSSTNVLAFPIVEMPAGQLTTTFAFRAVDDAVHLGTRTVTVTARSDVLRPATNTVAVLEDDPHHFKVNRVPVSREAHVQYTGLVLTACDAADDPLPGFQRSASLAVAGPDGPVEVSPGLTQLFSGGLCTQAYSFLYWGNQVRLTVSDGQGHTGESNPFNIKRPAQHVIGSQARNIVWDSVRSQVVASVGWNGTSNYLAFINPESGRIVETLGVAGGPNLLAISDDSRYLYFSLTATNNICRVDLETRSQDLEWWLGRYTYSPSLKWPRDMAVQPWNRDVLVVTRGTVDDVEMGVAAYQQGVLLPAVYQSIYELTMPQYIEFGGSPYTLYGYYPRDWAWKYSFSLTSSGVTLQGAGGFLMPPGQDFRYGGGRLYMTGGTVYGVEPYNSIVGYLPNSGFPIPAPDLRILLHIRQSYLNDTLQVFDHDTLSLQHEQSIPGARGYVSSAIRCGPTRVAFVDTAAGQIYIVNSEYLADLDRDGLPDAWEREHFGSTTDPDATALVDADHDGLSNLDEYLAGTDPDDPASAVRLTPRATGQGNVQLEFPTVLGRCYQLQRAEDLANGSWTTVEELPGTGNAAVVTDGAALPASRQFYRLKVWQ